MGQQLPRVRHERLEQGVLGLRQVDGRVPDRDEAAADVHLDLAETLDWGGWFAGLAPAANPLHVHFVERVAALPGLGEDDRRMLVERCTQAIGSGVVPAYQRLIAVLESSSQNRRQCDGKPEGC